MRHEDWIKRKPQNNINKPKEIRGETSICEQKTEESRRRKRRMNVVYKKERLH